MPAGTSYVSAASSSTSSSGPRPIPVVVGEGGAVPDLHANVQGGGDLDLVRVASLGAARLQLGCDPLPERVPLGRHNCAD